MTDDRAYKQQATDEIHIVNCNVISVDMKNKQEIQKLTDETEYKKEAIYAMNNAKQIMENVSDVHYKSFDQFGGFADIKWCFQIPADKNVRAAVDTSKIHSYAEYKKASTLKCAFIPANTSEFTRLKKMQQQYSDLE